MATKKKMAIGTIIGWGLMLYLAWKAFAKGNGGNGAAVALKVYDEFGNILTNKSPVELEEGKAFGVEVTAQNKSTSLGTLVPATFTIKTSALINGLIVMPLISDPYNFIADEIHAFNYPAAINIPLGGAGKTGKVEARIISPENKEIAYDSEPILVKAQPVIPAADLLIYQADKAYLMKAPSSGAPGDVFYWADSVWYYDPTTRVWKGWSRTAPAYANDLTQITAGLFYSVDPNLFIEGQSYAAQMVLTNKTTQAGLPIAYNFSADSKYVDTKNIKVEPWTYNAQASEVATFYHYFSISPGTAGGVASITEVVYTTDRTLLLGGETLTIYIVAAPVKYQALVNV